MMDEIGHDDDSPGVITKNVTRATANCNRVDTSKRLQHTTHTHTHQHK